MLTSLSTLSRQLTRKDFSTSFKEPYRGYDNGAASDVGNLMGPSSILFTITVQRNALKSSTSTMRNAKLRTTLTFLDLLLMKKRLSDNIPNIPNPLTDRATTNRKNFACNAKNLVYLGGP